MQVDQIRQALIAAGVTGPHASHSREGNIRKIHTLLNGEEPEATFGLSGLDRYSASEVLGFMSDLTGCPVDIADLSCADGIDPDRTIRGLIAAGEKLRDEAKKGSSMLAATGHPTGMLEFYMRLSDAFVRAGGKEVRLREGEDLPIGRSGRTREVRYVGGVGCVADWGSLKHTHSSAAMEALLESEPWPALVLGDHGFAGAALERGIPTIAIMDINDHALAIAHAERKDVTIVPLDDNRPPRLYEPALALIESVIFETDE
ncbi:MAG TPA: phosphatase [Actinomycetota bacterium]|nr:phosphatase [Actinomycetota bacterium]